MNFRVYSNNLTKRFQVKFPSDVFYMKAKLEIENLGLYFKDARSSSEKKQMSNSQSQIGNSQEMYMVPPMNPTVNSSSQPAISLHAPSIMSQTIPGTPPIAAGGGGGVIPPSSSSQGTTLNNGATDIAAHTPFKRTRVDDVASLSYSQVPATTPSSSSSSGVLASIRPSQNPGTAGRRETNMESIHMSQPLWEDPVAISSSPFHPSQYSVVAATPLGSQNQGLPMGSAVTPRQDNNNQVSSLMNLLPSPPTTSSPSVLPPNLTEEEKLLRDKILFYLQQNSFLQLCQSLDRVWATIQHT
ncbi:meiotic recombination protein Rec7, variant [Schizosaccharomyces cryophilus OY26]|nr:meiotic recombination protein Rec7, variant [Schizosaccharomyces cryophilus OY26]EPY51327.1 meiotic recombination protein Rec7, variant [Schizosaccharomyces cryophilus OY26]